MLVRFDNSLISRIQQATDIVDIVSEHVSLAKKGKELVGLCPFHADHKPSLYVNPVKQIFKCFACSVGGDVFKFIQLRENLSFPQAIERLAQRAGVKLPRRTEDRRSCADSQLDPGVLAKVNVWAKKFWQGNLRDEQTGQQARSYLQQRQINSESVKAWGLGFASDGWESFITAAKAAKIPETMLAEAGFAVARDNGTCYDKFRNRLMFPILDVTERVIGFGGRTLANDPAKYMNSPRTTLFDKSNSLYGLDKARHEIVATGTAVVVEGYTDVIMCHQFGCINVVATLGTSFTDGHARILRRYAKRIVLVFDSDVAGMEAANRALEVCLSQRIDIKLAFAPEGKDPCDFILTAGRQAFEQVVDEGVDVMEFKWQRLLEGLSGSDNFADKRAATEEYLRTVATAIKSGRLDPIARGLITGKLSGIIGLSSEQINQELDRLSGRLGRGESFAVRNQRVMSLGLDGFLAKAQCEILEVLLNEPELFGTIAGKITVEMFTAPALEPIAKVVFGLVGNGEQITITNVLAKVASVEVAGAVVELAEAGEKKGNYVNRLAEAIDVIQSHIKNVEKNKIKADLNDDDSLRKFAQMLSGESKRNRRNPGMIPT